MTDLYSQINYFNPSHAEAITAFIDNESGHNDALIDLECDIIEFDSCIVGEIHNYDGSYAINNNYDNEDERNIDFCDKCRFYANELSERFFADDRGMFAELLLGLYDHIRQVDHKVSDE